MTQTIAFYAPLKSPNHETPSGDRQVARLFTSLFKELGYHVNLMSNFRSWSAESCTQKSLKDQALQEAKQLCNDYEARPKAERPILWFTYHLYHKAPDWIGPLFCNHFNIPYIIAEASIAPKRANGEWALGYQDALHAIMQASYTLTLAPHDQDILSKFIPQNKLISFLPFIQIPPSVGDKQEIRQQLARTYGLPPEKKWLLTVAMMRDDCKKDSYVELINALSHTHPDETCAIFIGDGEARTSIEAKAIEAGVPIFFLGKLSRDLVNQFYQASNLYLWPAINEAYGMSILEAQAAGLPVIAGDFGSVSTLVEHEKTGIILPQNQPHLFAESINSLLQNQTRLNLFSQTALKQANEKFGFQRAKTQMQKIIETLMKEEPNV